jgi:putative DNA primase/helicase
VLHTIKDVFGEETASGVLVDIAREEKKVEVQERLKEAKKEKRKGENKQEAFCNPNSVQSQIGVIAEKLIALDAVRIFNGLPHVKTDDGVWTTNERKINHTIKIREGYKYMRTPDIRNVLDEISNFKGKDDEYEENKKYVDLQNCRFDIYTGQTSQLSDNDAIFSKLDCDYHSDAPDTCQLVDDFISRLVDERKDEIDMVWEMIGYVLLPINKKQMTFMLYGQGGTGKSVLLNVISRIVGYDNVIAPRLDKLNDSAVLASIYGKQLCVVDDAEQYVGDTSGFKILASGGLISAKFLYKEYFTFRYHGHIIMSTNEVPHMFDSKEAVSRRVIIIPCTSRSLEQKDRIDDLEDKLLEHKEYIVKKALTHLQGIIKRKEFTQSERSLQFTAEAVEADNSAVRFFNRITAASLEGRFKHEVYREYVKQTKEDGLKEYGAPKFGKELALYFDFDRKNNPRKICEATNKFETYYRNVVRIKGHDPSEDEEITIDEDLPF